MVKKGGLGKGLESLMGEANAEVGVMNPDSTLPLSKIKPNKGQPRKRFDPAELAELTDSIKQNGVLQPLLVRKNGSTYEIVAGERRYQAAKAAGLEEVPVIIRDVSDDEIFKLALIENLQRSDLNPIEEAKGYRTLIEAHGLTQDEVAKSVGRSRPAVTNALRLLSLGETLQKKVSSGKLSAGHARALLPLKTETLREKAAAEVESRGLSVRQTETLVASLLRQAEQSEKEEKKPPVVDYVREAEKALSDALGRGVKFQGGQKKGRIALEFYSADDREALMEALKHMDKPWKKK